LSLSHIGGFAGEALVSPLIIEVMGPSEASLDTACYVDNVFVKTPVYRIVEQQAIAMIQSHLDTIRSPSMIKTRVSGCLAEKLMAHRPAPIGSIRMMLRMRASIVPQVASLMLKIKAYNKIAEHTDLGRAPSSVAIAYKEIEAAIHDLLFKV
jgi:hypothetical protein